MAAGRRKSPSPSNPHEAKAIGPEGPGAEVLAQANRIGFTRLLQRLFSAAGQS